MLSEACSHVEMLLPSPTAPFFPALWLFPSVLHYKAARSPQPPLQYLARHEERPSENHSYPLNMFPFDLLPFPGSTTYSTAHYFGYLVPALLTRDFRSPVSQQHGDSDFSLARRDRTRKAGDARKFLAFSWAICCPVPPCWKGL